MAFPRLTEVSVYPSVKEAYLAVMKAVSNRKILIVAGNCWVEYEGRAKSRLQPGERLLIVKPDGSLLVHRSAGYEPVNWMPGGEVVLDTNANENVLELRALRKRPVETVKTFFDKVYLVCALSLTDSGVFALHASEEDMQRAIIAKPEILESGFKPISYEKKVEPGFVDIYGMDKNGKLVVVEIKRKTATKEAALQLSRYIDAIKGKADRDVRGILVAPSLMKGVQKLLETLGLEFKHMDPRICVQVLQTVETKGLTEFF